MPYITVISFLSGSPEYWSGPRPAPTGPHGSHRRRAERSTPTVPGPRWQAARRGPPSNDRRPGRTAPVPGSDHGQRPVPAPRTRARTRPSHPPRRHHRRCRGPGRSNAPALPMGRSPFSAVAEPQFRRGTPITRCDRSHRIRSFPGTPAFAKAAGRHPSAPADSRPGRSRVDRGARAPCTLTAFRFNPILPGDGLCASPRKGGTVKLKNRKKTVVSRVIHMPS
jgi:hypothetical protein